jgi:serine/threonine-protein kinase PknG
MTAPCRRAGCSGTVEDGYCNVCGHAAAPGGDPVASPVAAAPAGRPPAAAVDDGACGRPGCSGTVEDGYCNVCGHARTAAVSVPAGGTGPSGSGAADRGSTTTQETGRVGRVVPEGSARTGTAPGGGSPGAHGSLGAGLVEMPDVPVRDPADAVLVDPGVPERKRFCATCGEPVGREREGRPGRTEGWCAHCGSPFSFTPKLHPGDRVAGQYDVAGCLAHGGLGWVYLARDSNVNDRWVVLKGLLDSQDRSAMAAAIAERRFLAEVRHPNIVSIYNFVQHEDAGYIVMEYVGGESLREVRNGHRERFGGPLPVAQAIAYILGILPAFAYLHRRGLLFCDFKPDNVIQSDDHVKLIDLGGVRSVDDDDSDLYGTVGYQAPEVSDSGASVSSDLYTVARTLAVLSFDFAGFQDVRRFATSLPPVHEVPQFARYESFHLFLLKATAEDPRARFQSAGEMADQLAGVLREVVAVDGGSPATAPSLLFSGELGVEPESCTWQNLPLPVVDPLDAAAPLLATAVLAGPDQARAVLQSAPHTPELVFHLARLAIDDGDLDGAASLLDGVEARRGGWRAAWWRGVLALTRGAPEDAQPLFAAVGAELPGERAPRLALAVAHEQAAGTALTAGELGRHLAEAARYYGLVVVTDRSFASAMFGLARVRSALGDRSGAADALTLVPSSSSAYTAAQLALCRVRSADIGDEPPQVSDLVAASEGLDRLRVESSVRLPLLRQLQSQALVLLSEGRVAPDADCRLGGAVLVESSMREALEQTLRSLAKAAPTERERCELVDLANAHRPRTLT